MKSPGKKNSDTRSIVQKTIAILCIVFFILPSVQAISQGTDSNSNQDLSPSGDNNFWIQVIGRGAIQNEVAFPYLIRYGNNGTQDIPAPLIALSSVPSSSDVYIKIGTSDWRSMKDRLIISSHGAENSPEKLAPGSSFSIPIKVISYNNTEFSIIATPLTATYFLSPPIAESVIDGSCPAPGFPLEFSRTYRSGFSSNNGPMGYGWIHSYDIHLEKMGDGNIVLMQGGSYAGLFFESGNGIYLSQNGESSLSLHSDGSLSLNDKNGNLMEFNADHLLMFIQDSRKNSVSLTYNKQKQLENIKHSSGDVFYFSYNNEGKINRFTDHAGRTTTYEYETGGNLLSRVTSPDGLTTEYVYTPGLGGYGLTSIIYPDDSRYDLTYDGNGNLITESTAGGKYKLQYSYDPRSLTTQTIGSDGSSGKITLNPLGQTTGIQGSGADTNIYLYNQKGAISEVKNSEGQTSKLSYDDEGYLVAITDNAGRQTSFGYVPLSDNIAWSQDPLGRRTTYAYDDQDNLIETKFPDQSVDRYTYNDNNFLAEYRDSADKVRKFSWNKRGQITTVQDARGYSAKITYDPAGNPSSVTDYRGNSVSNEYDKVDRLVKKIYPDGSNEQYEFNSKGVLVSLTNRKGEKIVFEYNSDGNVETETYPSGKQFHYSYDGNGNIATTDISSTTNRQISFTYSTDTSGRILNKSVQGLASKGSSSLSRGYDSDGNLARMTYPDGYELRYRYDKDGHLSAIIDGHLQPVVAYQYDKIGRVIQKTMGNGVSTAYDYDVRDRLTSIKNYAADGKIISEYSYTYNPAGFVTAERSPEGISQYYYDNSYQITRVEYPDRTTAEYQYDEAGNRINANTNTGKTEYKTNNLDQYTQAGAEAFTYDKNGNLLIRSGNEGVTQYSWDEDNRLTGVIRNNISISYQYDDAGRLITKKTAGSITHYLWDNSDLIAEMDDTGHITKRYVYGNEINELIFLSRDGQNAWVLQNAIGSVTNTLNRDGTVLGKGAYDIYGIKRDSISTGINQGFAGMYWDTDTGLYYVRNRWYDPGLGRFISLDYFQNIIDNRYIYASNSPVTFKDINGLKGEKINSKVQEVVYPGVKIFQKASSKIVDDYLKNNPKVVTPASQLQWNSNNQIVSTEVQSHFNYEKLNQIKTYQNLKTGLDVAKVAFIARDSWNYGTTIDQFSQGKISGGQFATESTKYGVGTTLSIAGAAGATWAGPAGIVWTGGSFISDTYQDTQKLKYNIELDNTLNDYRMRGYDNYINMANNLKIPKNERLSYNDWNIKDAGNKQMNSWAQKYFSTQPSSNQPSNPTLRISQDDIKKAGPDIKWSIPPHNDDGGGGGGVVISPLSPNSKGIGTNPPGGVDFSNIQLNSISISNDSDAEIFSYTMKTTIARPGEKGVNVENTMDLSSKAFFTGLTMPNSALWVNLRPDEPDRIIDKDLAKTDVGRIMLQADLDMKKDYARFENGCVYPVGAEYHKIIKQKERDLLNNLKLKYPNEADKIDKMSFNTMIGHWIGPDRIDAQITGNQIFIENLSLTITRNPTDKDAGFKVSDQNSTLTSDPSLSAELTKDLDVANKDYLRYAAAQQDLIISPLVINEVNSGSKYADLRTVYSSIALAQWYKEKFRGTNGIFSDIIDTRDLKKLGSSTPWNFQDTYKEYLNSYNKGEFECRINTSQAEKTTTMENGSIYHSIYTEGYTYHVGGVVFSKIPITTVSETTPEIDQIMKEAIFQESPSSSGFNIIGKDAVTKGNILYTGDSIFSVKKSPIRTKTPYIDTKNSRKSLIPPGWSTTLLVIIGAVVIGIAILIKLKSKEDYEDDNY